ncbi:MULTISPECIES: PhoX family protein [unclassified Coleofasciculus]|uniref:PhoX family protein n=1 Tax=unclassified Coleofasciculus TaxID=2692782 RepID=UPI00188224C9|nr:MULTISPECIES: alkaline phosphatase PhoX [unclassified Coleofasciculus]MBE9130168.1 DUF839 domain-containing protein [Coleofasciculus sp. LEGE 07081]MBE9152505.1 DUF839 domain-containing protein [Coleofasciculus sp. LEGE 07092]
MALKRRDFLLFVGASAGAVALHSCASGNSGLSGSSKKAAPKSSTVGFKPVRGSMPLETDGIELTKQVADYGSYEVVDDLVLPEGFTYDIIGAWGDNIGDSRFGYNNDYLSFIETGKDEGLLTINFEYISGSTWMQTYQQVIGQSLPFDEVKAAVANSKGKINAFALPDSDALKAKIREISKEGLVDQGLGVISIRKTADGKWRRTHSSADRRITGISGLEDDRYLKATGPAVAIFRKQQGQGYIDGLGDRIIGTFQNCAGGTTPWGTVLSAEENVQDQVPEPVYVDGTSFDPEALPFQIDDKTVDGRANVFGLAGNKYGWMVEIDPANPDDYGTKHTWLGRFRHEAVALKAVAGKPLAVYSGCDRRGGHLYKFVSKGTINKPQDKANSQLFSDGMLYAAVFEPDGTGRWIALEPKTSVNPVLPSTVEGNLVPLPKRPEGGIFEVKTDADATSFKEQFATLGDLYEGNETEKQGAILIDAHYAANAAGATTTARPEDTEIAPDGSLYIAFTSGSPGDDGGPDKRIFKGLKGETPWEYGWIVRLVEDGDESAAMTFQWESFAMGGEPAEGGAGFANPDNLEFDANGNLWMVTDISTSKHNQTVTSRVDAEGKPLEQTDIQGIFGNNSIWVLPTSGSNAGNAYLFGIGPMECETTGLFFTPDQKTLFLAVQHPGEQHGMRKDKAAETRKFTLKTTDGKEFVQKRLVPLGSNWPSKGTTDPPKPAVVAIRRLDAEPI